VLVQPRQIGRQAVGGPVAVGGQLGPERKPGMDFEGSDKIQGGMECMAGEGCVWHSTLHRKKFNGCVLLVRMTWIV
jgi:hypothetical protein